ncbi:MAG TPA: DUF6088 family protein [Bryobacteraceae bacterium]|nr:DUF6088 family protein [Bryobacteraceae bacterium]
MPDLAMKVLNRIRAANPGAAFTPKAFGDLGNRAAVDQALSRLTKAGKIRRISRGVYDIPQTHPRLGQLSPDPDSVARAIAAQAGYRLQLTPARAANVLGLSSQVPAQIVYLIDGSSRKITVGNQIIHFKHAGSRTLLGAGTPAGVALQAIRAFGPDHLTAGVIRQLRKSLPSDAKTSLKKLAHHAPQWMASAIAAVTA